MEHEFNTSSADGPPLFFTSTPPPPKLFTPMSECPTESAVNPLFPFLGAYYQCTTQLTTESPFS